MDKTVCIKRVTVEQFNDLKEFGWKYTTKCRWKRYNKQEK